MNETKTITVEVASSKHLKYVDIINDHIDLASKQRGTGIARRTYEYLAAKMDEGKAVIALDGEEFAGFCYIETWGTSKYVANSGLIVNPAYRGIGLAKQIKMKAFELSRTRYPDAKIFGLTTGLAVMKINHQLGYRPVTYSELTDDESFWKGCQGCVNYDILTRTERSKCLCTGMLFDPAWEQEKNPSASPSTNGSSQEIRKRSLLDYMKKLNPLQAMDLIRKYSNKQPKV